MQLIVPGAWDGIRKISLPTASAADGEGTVWTGPQEWRNPYTGQMLTVYDRRRTNRREGSVEQKMGVRADGSAIGRVYDSRFLLASGSRAKCARSNTCAWQLEAVKSLSGAGPPASQLRNSTTSTAVFRTALGLHGGSLTWTVAKCWTTGPTSFLRVVASPLNPAGKGLGVSKGQKIGMRMNFTGQQGAPPDAPTSCAPVLRHPDMSRPSQRVINFDMPGDLRRSLRR
jgi:hypothetical protein